MATDQPHDTLFKAIFGRAAAARELFTAFLPAAIVAELDLSSLRLESANPVGDRLSQRFADLLFSIRVGRTGEDRGLLHLLLEHKSHPDPFTILDLFTSTALILNDWVRRHPRAEKVPFVLPIVVYHGPSSAKVETDLRGLFATDPEFKSSLQSWMPTFPVVFVDLGTTPDLDLRRIHERDNASGCGLWLLKWSRRPGFEERLLAESTWVGAVIESDEAGRAARPLLRYTLTFIEPRTDPRAFAAKLGERLGRKAEPMARNLLESLIEEGRKEGRVEGRVETLRRVIERLIENRFGAASAAAIASVRKANDIESLDSLFEAATRAGSLAEFEEHLRSLDRHG